MHGAANRQLCDLRMRWFPAPRLRQPCRTVTRQMMSDELSQRILSVLNGMPDWLRRDLSSREDANRQRAEESLSAMTASALSDNTGS